MVDCKNKQRPITEDEFETFSKRFKAPLPPSFKAHYLQSNAMTVPEAFRQAHPGVFNSFLPIQQGDLTIEDAAERYAQIPSENFTWQPGEFVPFACDDGGNLYLISLKSTDYGNIYIHAIDGDILSAVAASFDEFLARLSIPSPE